MDPMAPFDQQVDYDLVATWLSKQIEIERAHRPDRADALDLLADTIEDLRLHSIVLPDALATIALARRTLLRLAGMYQTAEGYRREWSAGALGS